MIKFLFVLVVVLVASLGCKRVAPAEPPAIGAPVSVVDGGTPVQPVEKPVAVDAGAVAPAAVDAAPVATPAAAPDVAPVAPAADAVVLVAPATATVTGETSGG